MTEPDPDGDADAEPTSMDGPATAEKAEALILKKVY